MARDMFIISYKFDDEIYVKLEDLKKMIAEYEKLLDKYNELKKENTNLKKKK